MMNQKTSLFRKIARSRVVHVMALGGILWAACVAGNRHLNAPPTLHLPPIAGLPNPNAYDDFRRAASLNRLKWKYGTDGQPHLLNGITVDSALHANADAMTVLRQGLTHAFQMPIDRKLYIGEEIPLGKRCVEYRSLARTLAFEARVDAARGDAEGAMRYALDGVQLGIMIPRGGAILPRQTGHDCEEIGRKQASPLVEKLTLAQTEHALSRLQAIEAMRTPIADSLREEKATGLGQRFWMVSAFSAPEAFVRYAKPGAWYSESDNDGRTKPEHGNAFRDWYQVATLSRQDFLDNYSGAMDTRIAWAHQPCELYAMMRSFPHFRMDTFNRLIDRNEEDYTSLAYDDATARLNNRFLTIRLALHAYRLLHGGALPDALGELVTAGALKAVPADPFAKVPNTPLGYSRAPGVIYSVGPSGLLFVEALVTPATRVGAAARANF